MQDSESIVLYTYWRSSCSWRVKWAFALKGLEFIEKPINLLQQEQKSEQYTKLNPMGCVPTMQIGANTYGESLAIIEWLEETYPNPRLLPVDSLSRMHVRHLSYLIASGTQPLQNLAAMRYHSKLRSEQVSYAAHWIMRGLQAYEAALKPERSEDDFSFGPSPTVADLCLVPQCYNALRFGVELSRFPQVKAIYDKSLQTEACQRHYPKEPDNS